MLISNRQNRLVKRFMSVRDRRDPTMIYLEGWRNVKEALRSGLKVHALLYQQDRLTHSEIHHCVSEGRGTGAQVHAVTAGVMRQLSEVTTPPGIVSIVDRPFTDLNALAGIGRGAPLLLAAVGVRDPGNLGTIIRAADSFGATGLVTLPASADPYSPKVVRASAGSVLHLPIASANTYLQVRWIADQRALTTYGTSARSGNRPDEVDLSRGSIIFLGPEATGLSEEILNLCDGVIRIPRRPVVESLNVAVAASVLLYEAARQRGFKL